MHAADSGNVSGLEVAGVSRAAIRMAIMHMFHTYNQT